MYAENGFDIYRWVIFECSSWFSPRIAWVSGVSGEKEKDGSEKGRNLLSPSPLGRPDTQASPLNDGFVKARDVEFDYAIKCPVLLL